MIDGDGVREWLEMSAGAFNKIDPNAGGEQPLLNEAFPSYNFDVIDGVEYRVDVTQEPRYGPRGELINDGSHRTVDLTYKGQPIDLAQKFIVATNNYRAGGGGNFPGLDVIEAPDENRTVLGSFIFDRKTIDPSADGNWSFLPAAGDANVTFLSAPDAEKMLTPDTPIEPAGVAENGFAKYRIHLN